MKEDNKRVSVVMCTYNGERYLREQLNSIVNQEYPIYELIIQDDRSKDRTIDIVKEYMDKYSYIKLYVNKQNLGFNRNFKSAAMKATGDFVALSDQDDVWFPDKIETQMKTIGDCSICCSYYVFGSDMKTATVIKPKIGAERVLFSSILAHTMLCRRDVIQQEDIWLMPVWYDWGLSVNGFLNGGVTIVSKPLNWHRHHTGETSFVAVKKKPKPYLPYLLGYKCYRKRQKTKAWAFMYSYIYERTGEEHLPLVHKISGLLLKTDVISFLKLCVVCLRFRDKVYPQTEVGKGIMSYVRGFCFPLFWCYSNEHYFRDFN